MGNCILTAVLLRRQILTVLRNNSRKNIIQPGIVLSVATSGPTSLTKRDISFTSIWLKWLSSYSRAARKTTNKCSSKRSLSTNLSQKIKAFPPYVLKRKKQIYPKLPSEEDCIIIYLQIDEKYTQKRMTNFYLICCYKHFF